MGNSKLKMNSENMVEDSISSNTMTYRGDAVIELVKSNQWWNDIFNNNYDYPHAFLENVSGV